MTRIFIEEEPKKPKKLPQRTPKNLHKNTQRHSTEWLIAQQYQSIRNFYLMIQLFLRAFVSDKELQEHKIQRRDVEDTGDSRAYVKFLLWE